MKLLDKYLLKKFLSTYLFVTAMIVLIILIIDFVEKNDNFMKNSAPFKEILFTYYLNLAPYWANLLSPLMIFVSTVFFTSRMASHTEIVAILTSGVSYRRFLMPYVLGALAVGAFTFYIIGWVLPKANKKRLKFENTYVKDHSNFSISNLHMGVAPNVYLYVGSYYEDTKTGSDITLEKFKGTRLVEKLKANRMVFNDTTHKWKLEEYTIRKLGVPKDKMLQGAKIDTALAVSPEDFENDQSLYETFTLPQLNHRINVIKARGSEGIATYLIERYQRYASPFAVVILALIGVLLSSKKSRRGIAFQITLGFLLAFSYLIFFILSKGIAASGDMDPLLAVWLPNIIFTGIGFGLYVYLPK